MGSATATVEFIESYDLHILTSFDEIFSVTDDMILKIEIILSTRYATSCEYSSEGSFEGYQIASGDISEYVAHFKRKPCHCIHYSRWKIYEVS